MKKILLVDDEESIQIVYREEFEDEGYQVFSALNGNTALEKFKEEEPDLVILDIMMPDVSGLDVLRYMRGEPDLKDIPVILVSAKSMPTDIQEGMNAGASTYLTKPVGFLELKSAVEELVPLV